VNEFWASGRMMTMSDEVKNCPQLPAGFINEILSEAIYIRMIRTPWQFFNLATILLPCRYGECQWNTLDIGHIRGKPGQQKTYPTLLLTTAVDRIGNNNTKRRIFAAFTFFPIWRNRMVIFHMGRPVQSLETNRCSGHQIKYQLFHQQIRYDNGIAA
jgi:hypothetical protein